MGMPNTNRIDHTTCSHEATKAGRTACRAAHASRLILAQALVDYLDRDTSGIADWLLKGAIRFDRSDDHAARRIDPTDRLALALSLLDYFDPQISDDARAYRARNGYTFTTDPATIRRLILSAHS